MWCDIKNTKYGDKLKKQLGVRNAEDFSIAVQSPKFLNWFGNGKTQRLENGAQVPYINPVMQVINEKGKAFNLLERFRFGNVQDARNFLTTNYTPGIRRWDSGEDTFFIAKDDNRLINVKLLEEIDRIYPGIIVRTPSGELFSTTKDYQASSIESAAAKPTWFFTLNKNYSPAQTRLFSNIDRLQEQASQYFGEVKGLYKDMMLADPAQSLYEAAVQANSSPTEEKTATKIFGPEIIAIARQMYPTAAPGISYEEHLNNQTIEEKSPVDTKLVTLLDKLSLRFNIPYRTVNNPSATWNGYYDVNGTIVINTARATKETAFHEFLHPFMAVLRDQNRELYQSLVNDMENSPDGQQVMMEVIRNYGKLTEEQQMDEALVTYIGRLAEAKHNVPMSPFSRFVKWLKNLFKKINISFDTLDLTTSIADVTNLIVDDVFVADIKAQIRNADVYVKYSKSQPDTDVTYETIFDRIKDRVAILNATIKNRKQGEQFIDDIDALNTVLKNADEITSINNFVSNAIVYVEKAKDRFERLRDSVKDSKNLSKEDLNNNMYVLSEIQQLLNVYESLDDIKSLYVREGMKSTDDTMAKLRDAIDTKDLIAGDFKSFALTYLTEWLYPYIEPTNATLKAMGNDADIVTKDMFRNQLSMALRDISAAGYWLGATINSQDPISAAIGLALKDVVYNNHVGNMQVKKELMNAYDEVRGTSLYATKANEETFNLQFLKEVEVYEQNGVDENGQPTYGYVSHLAFHEEYNDDQFDKARREFYKSLGERPKRSDKVAYNKYSAAVNKWYKDNTSIRPNINDFLIDKQKGMTKRQFEQWMLANTQETEDATYDGGMKKSDYFRGRIYSRNEKKGTFRVFTGEFVLPAAKYKNPEFAKQMSNKYTAKLYKEYKQANEKLGTYGLRYGMIPQVSKGKNLFSSLAWEKGIKGNAKQLKTNAGREIKADPDSNKTVQRQDGTEVKKIPILYTKSLNRDDLQIDLLQNTLKFVQMANNYAAMNEIEPNILILKTVLNGDFNLGIEGRKIAKTNAKGKGIINAITKKIVPKMSEEGRLNARLNEFINDIVYGDDEFQETVNILGKEISLNKVGSKIGLLTALQNMALNVNGGISNVVIGNFSNAIEAFGGRFWGKRDWAWAHKEYFANLPDFLGELAGQTTSAVNVMADHYSVPQGEFEDQFGNNLTGGAVNKMLKTSSLFFIQKGGEHEIQMTGMMALMHNTPVTKADGTVTNLYQAWKQSEGNFAKVKGDFQWSDEQDAAFRNRLHAITKNLQGVYNKFDKSTLQRRWLGKLAIMFRKYMFTAFKSRYGTKYVDYELGTTNEGYWNTFFKKLVSEVKDYKWHVFSRMWTKEGYSDLEKSAVNKTLFELGIMLATMILAGMVDDDDDKNWIEAEAALQLTRMSADISQYISPGDFIRIIRNPAASMNMVEKWIGWGTQLVTDPTGEYKRGAGFAEKGDNKLYIKTLKLMPVLRQFINLMTPEEQIKFYNLTGGGK